MTYAELPPSTRIRRTSNLAISAKMISGSCCRNRTPSAFLCCAPPEAALFSAASRLRGWICSCYHLDNTLRDVLLLFGLRDSILNRFTGHLFGLHLLWSWLLLVSLLPNVSALLGGVQRAPVEHAVEILLGLLAKGAGDWCPGVCRTPCGGSTPLRLPSQPFHVRL